MPATGTFEIDGDLFPKDPLRKRWIPPRRVGTKGGGAGVYTAFWRCELSFGTLDAGQENSFFVSKFASGDLHTVKLPHPWSSQLVTFTGAALEEISFEFDDTDNNKWAIGSRVVFGHINLMATGT